jgi:hypothetical protein
LRQGRSLENGFAYSRKFKVKVMRKKNNILCIAMLVGLLCGCGNTYQYIPKDVEAVEVEIVRFDSAQLAVRTDSVRQDIERLYTDYEEFMPMFVEGILGLPTEDTAYLCALYADFLTDTVMGFAQTNALAKEKFAHVDNLQKELNTGFSRLHYLYPDWDIPSKVYLFVSGFNSSVIYYENIIGVGTDMYLGSDYPYYNQVVYDYQKQTMRKECIVGDIMSMYLSYHIAYNSKYNRLLEQMIFRGKQMFLLRQLLPDEPEWEIIGYSQEQWNWCELYERAIWNRIMEKKDLFKTESLVLSSYMNDGPFTAEVTQDSPGRLGQWVGWRIVDSYMRHNKHVTLLDLMNESDAQKILEQSFYNP